MALFNFQCYSCGWKGRQILTPEEVEAGQQCPECNETLTWVPTGPSTVVKEVLDNGVMARPVERIADTERIMQERSDAHKQGKV